MLCNTRLCCSSALCPPYWRSRLCSGFSWCRDSVFYWLQGSPSFSLGSKQSHGCFRYLSAIIFLGSSFSEELHLIDLIFLFLLKFKGHRNYFPSIFVHSLALTISPNSLMFSLFHDKLLVWLEYVCLYPECTSPECSHVDGEDVEYVLKEAWTLHWKGQYDPNWQFCSGFLSVWLGARHCDRPGL